MTHGSLFSGIGGFDLAAQWMGWQNVFHCEWNEFGQKVLKYYWPDAISYNDITKTDFTIHRGSIDILTGGFPCQPYSMAGKRLGKEDDRHLWPEMLRAIREIQPRWVVGENVLGLVNWSGGLVFHEVQTDLEAEGYEVQPYVLPAVSVNAPHRRDRVWFVAHNNSIFRRERGEFEPTKQPRYRESNESRNSKNDGFVAHANGIGCGRRSQQSEPNKSEKWKICKNEQQNRDGVRCEIKGCCWIATNTDSIRLEQRENAGEMGVGQTKMGGSGCEFTDAPKADGSFANAPNTCNKGLQRQQNKGEDRRTKSEGIDNRRGNASGVFRSNWQEFPTQPPICYGNDGISDRLDGITFSKWRQESIKAGGNAVVPQVVLQIFRAIEQYEKMNAR